MYPAISKYLNYKYPRNFIINRPFTGGMIIAIFCFGFIMIYKPLGTHAGRYFSYYATMAVYSLACGAATVLSVRLLRSFKWFSGEKWSLLKELISIFLAMTGIGIVIYFMGFLIESPSARWNVLTFLDSVSHGILLSIIPFLFFTLSNYRYLFSQEYHHHVNSGTDGSYHQQDGYTINISSQLKKESLSFYPNELIFAESDGNYVVFYLSRNNQVKKEIIRNSINNIEQQLSAVPYFFRTHRAFIVNLNKITGRHGTTLGYTLKLEGTETRVPVSRTNTKKFNSRFSAYRD
jgi:hypothetical protein